MNASEGGTEPLGASPDAEPEATKFPAVEPVTYYRARCTSCGAYAEYDEFGAFEDSGRAIEAARDECDWFERTRDEVVSENPTRIIAHTVELLCRDCQRCELCGNPRAYEMVEHLVCVDHEDHEFGDAA